MKICFATKNQNKLKEVQKLLPETIQLVSLNDLGHQEELEESFETLDENAQQKAEFVYRTYKTPCFADDTGLEVNDLNGAPGVHSAHFSGERNPQKNMELLLEQLKASADRTAQFRTVIIYYDGSEYVKFEGKVQGSITTIKKGEGGFGYDPIFQPEGYDITFGEMDLNKKNEISHRARAVNKLVEYLSNLDV